ncbi:MAG TPA: heme-copper oxidase subunit III [Pyrinomonadaceae bacterium]|jgi:cytochrome c oxidase subunit 3|nr:heme-copper oxidase subunit III [Pyrinomonadaceae bacterium]
MEIGTAETIPKPRKKRRLLSQFRGGRGPGSGNGGDGGDHGDGNDWPNNPTGDSGQVADKSKVVTWFVLLIVTMTFGGLIGAYVVLATNKAAEWQPFALPLQVWISTAIIVVSSFAYHFAKISTDRDEQMQARKWLIVTTVLGAAFISSQLLAWLALVNRGLYMSGNPYAGFFYLFTAVHALHVTGGIIALGVVLLRGWYVTKDPDEHRYRKNLMRAVGWYWHFMGVLWIFLFILLGFWK